MEAFWCRGLVGSGRGATEGTIAEQGMRMRPCLSAGSGELPGAHQGPAPLPAEAKAVPPTWVL